MGLVVNMCANNQIVCPAGDFCKGKAMALKAMEGAVFYRAGGEASLSSNPGAEPPGSRSTQPAARWIYPRYMRPEEDCSQAIEAGTAPRRRGRCCGQRWLGAAVGPFRGLALSPGVR